MWQKCLDIIRDNVGTDRFNKWFAQTEAVSFADNCLNLRVPTHFFTEMYDGVFYNLLRSVYARVFGSGVKVTYEFPVVSGDEASKVKIPSTEQSPAVTIPFEKRNFQQPAIRDGKLEKDKAKDFDPQLNGALTFENYCVGESNKLPYTIAEYISGHPKNSNFNPFFLFGDVGVGKTHLIQAIGLRVKERNPRAKVFFTTAKQFQTAFAYANISKNVPNFINWFMQMDVLLFDDLQEIANKVKTSNDALFPIFNHLHQNGRQLVFTCDRPPMELDGITDRLIDRFKWGITERLPRPDADLRRKILTFKAKHNGLDLPQEVIDCIAETAISSVRELEGIVMGILTRSIALNCPITVQLAREVMKNSVKQVVRKRLNFDMILEATAERFGINADVLYTKSRQRDIADARQVVMYLCHKLTDLSSVSIGAKLNRNHNTVLHGIATVRDRIEQSPEVEALVAEIEEAL